MKLILPLLVLLSTPTLFAQESIGFTDSTDFEKLINYRLPGWGYRQFSLENGGGNFNARTSYNERTLNDFDLEDRVNNNTSYRLEFTPRFESYFESEERVLHLTTLSSFRTNRSKSTTDFGEGSEDEELKRREYQFNELIILDLQEYVYGDFFLVANSSNSLNFRFSNHDRSSPPSSEFFSRSLNLDQELGIGFGRIRNITPVLRAIRLNERLKSVSGNHLSDEEIYSTSEQFTRYQAYTRTYDRPLKYFWGDLDDLISNKISDLPAFDQFYLNDVFNESYGLRLEGYQIQFKGGYNYLNGLSRSTTKQETEEIIDRNLSIRRVASAGTNFRYFKNISLDHQLSVTIDSRILFPLEQSDRDDWLNFTYLNMNWLWVVADRILLSNGVRSNFRSEKRKNIDDFKYHDVTSSLYSQLTYFIENQVSIDASFSFGHDYSYRNIDSDVTKNTALDLGVSFRIRYYFTRQLF
ncbi:MAG: hypothetical protein F6K19_19105 [Cyanothece sp. SIO1E1]|nr:hypothetical protein [Cyanothece sp. SIO1E1]